MSARRKARELALKCLYAYETTGQEPHELFETIKGETTLEDVHLQFALRLFEKVLANLATLDSEISQHSQNWDISRLAIIDKNIMRIAVCELLHYPDIPSRVSINEAIELAKKYSTPDSSAFVNGILNAIFKEHEGELESP